MFQLLLFNSESFFLQFLCLSLLFLVLLPLQKNTLKNRVFVHQLFFAVEFLRCAFEPFRSHFNRRFDCDFMRLVSIFCTNDCKTFDISTFFALAWLSNSSWVKDFGDFRCTLLSRWHSLHSYLPRFPIKSRLL